MSDPLEQSIDHLKGIGVARATRLREMGLTKVRDLIEYFPRRYQFEAEEMPIADLQADQIHTVRGEITACDYLRGARGGRFEATLTDDTDSLSLVWFNASWLRGKITPGMKIRVRGKVKFFRNLPQMANPTWQPIDDETPLVEESKLRPIYPATADMPSATIEKVFESVIDDASAQMIEWFEPKLLGERRLIPRPEAYKKIHHPDSYAEAYAAHRRLVYDELMLLQLGLGMARRTRGDRLSAPIVRVDKLLDERIRKRFGFELTKAQERCAFDIVRDMQSGNAMNRLLQGDVGSGKTAVALYAMLVAIANKLQSAILAPTEVLAEQHFNSISRFMAGSGVQVGLFTQRTKKNNAALRESLAEGQVHIAVGTQALIQGDIDFANLGIVVVDEQHRFGVRQRATLKGKGLSPHYLVMTATPIPRTLALSFFADFDVSTIDQLPPGRQVIETTWMRRDQSAKAYDLVKREVKLGRQAYIVVPKIDDTGLQEADVASLDKLFETLSNGPLRNLKLLKLHGRMSSEEKQEIMRAFRNKEADVLVATTVIEVGVDVPNATIMMIESAESFGLAQLHQLRGRVGRGTEQSYCILLSDAPTQDAADRMRTMVETSDGFELAEADLKMRGPGDFFGVRQSGLPQLKVADLTQELEMLKVCRDDAQRILNEDPDLKMEKHRGLREEIVRRFGEQLGLAQIG
jgi:ATP-dependent DNA helicase RecG